MDNFIVFKMLDVIAFHVLSFSPSMTCKLCELLLHTPMWTYMMTSLNISCQHLVLHLVYMSIDITKSYGMFEISSSRLLDADILLMILYIRQFPSRTPLWTPLCTFSSFHGFCLFNHTQAYSNWAYWNFFFKNWIFQQNMPIIKHMYDILHYDQ